MFHSKIFYHNVLFGKKVLILRNISEINGGGEIFEVIFSANSMWKAFIFYVHRFTVNSVTISALINVERKNKRKNII